MKSLAVIHRLPNKYLQSVSDLLPEVEPVLSGSRILPVCEPNIGEKERAYVNKAISSSWISSSGDFVERFEKEFARHISETSYAFAVNSGTSALHIALAALGIGPGDEVIMPTFTMIASANAVSYCNASPIFVDADPFSWNIDTSEIEKKITKRTKAIMVVHTYGAPVDMHQIQTLAKKYSLWIVEDAAEAHGATYKGKKVGGIGDVGAYSLYANKTMTTGEGGVAVTNNSHIAKRIKLLQNHAFSPERHFWHSMIGFGYRMTNLQAAVGVAQIERFEKLFHLKEKNAGLYKRSLQRVHGITTQFEIPHSVSSHWMMGILVDEKKFGMSKNKLRSYLAKNGIETRSFFIPIHLQPPYVSKFGFQRMSVSEQLCRDGLYLPSSTLLSEKDITYVCDAIQKAFIASQ